MENRKLFQKRLVKRLRLMMNWAFELHRAWNSALNIKEFGCQLPYSYLTLTISFAFGRVSRCEIQCTGRATKRVCTARAPAKKRRILFILDLAVESKTIPPLRVADRMRVRSWTRISVRHCDIPIACPSITTQWFSDCELILMKRNFKKRTVRKRIIPVIW